MVNCVVALVLTIALFSMSACVDGTPQRREASELTDRRAEVVRLTSQLKGDGRDASVLRALANELRTDRESLE